MKRERKKNELVSKNYSKRSKSRKPKDKQKIHQDEKIRLNKFISNSGICSRREADKFIEAGVVTVNGIGITQMGYRIGPNDIVKFNSQEIKSEKFRYILLNKPKNYSSKLDIKTQKISVMNLISSACKEHVFPIEKLNKSETGLLIFTNDNVLAKKLSNKKKLIKSIYQITLDKNLTQIDLKKIKAGLFMHGKLHTVNSISYIKNKEKNTIGVEHNKGGIKYIKDIFEKHNYKILTLDRVFFGGLTKKNLPRKHYRHLSEDEINLLKRL